MKLLSFLLISILITSVCFSQSNKLVVDSLELANGIKGLTNYHVLSSDESIFNGEFKLEKSFEDTTDNVFVNNIILKGNYNRNKKDGEWLYEFDRLRPAETRFVKNLKIVQPGIGERKVVNAHFEDGLAQGGWEITKKTVSSSQDVDTMFITTSEFKKNSFIGEFKSWCDSLTIEGNVNEQGFFDGEWVFHQKTREGNIVKEHRVYDNGILVEHKFFRDDAEYTVRHVGLDQTTGGEGEEWVELESNEDYFSIIYETNFGVDKDFSREKTNDLIGKSNGFLEYSIFSYGSHNNKDIWRILEEDKNINYPKVRVRKFSYTSEEKEQIEKAHELIKESRKIIEDYLNDPQVEINRHSYKDISFYYELYKVFKTELNKFENIFDKLSLSAYEYIDRDEIIPNVLEDITFPEKLSFQYEDEDIEEGYDFPENLKSEAATIGTLFNSLAEVHSKINETIKEIQPIIERNKTEAQIEHLENALVNKRDSIIDLFDNKLPVPDLNQYHEKFREEISKKVNEKFTSYSKKDVNERVDLINDMIDCFDTYISFHNYLYGLDKNIERIEEIYTRVVWNPFTFTDMEETVKERVYNAYKKYLLNDLFENLNSDISCHKIEITRRNLTTLFNRIRDLREADTKELEKSLRRQSDVDKIKELFELNFEN